MGQICDLVVRPVNEIVATKLCKDAVRIDPF